MKAVKTEKRKSKKDKIFFQKNSRKKNCISKIENDFKKVTYF